LSWLPQLATKGLKTLGDISYSLYLLHPLVYFGVVQILKSSGLDSPSISITLTVLFSVLVSYINYTYFEKYFIGVGKTFVSKIKTLKVS
jgi:peptidoglycan/LPS O-acetylase OafA/YrhL